ncbi:metallophosphoesterase family protein [Actinocorallia longicatena]|uniref:Phosphodiesterase n=1 Tax=Actinocorallia longicatena TaxID=111803 RepID=A0ABP6QHT2_9ACTN
MTARRPWPLPPSDGVLVHHVSDTHFGYRPWSYAEGDHMAADLRDNLVPVPDALIHTGDITDRGRAAEDRYALGWLPAAARGAPDLWAMGNHDVRDRPVHTRETWEKVYGRPANTFLDVKGYRFVAFAADDFTGDQGIWTIPDATWTWLDGVVGAAPGPVVLVNHFPPRELGVSARNALQPAAKLDAFAGDHPAITGYLCGHMHKALDDPSAAQFVRLGGRSLPVLCDISSMLSPDVVRQGESTLVRDRSAQVQSYSAFVTLRETRWEIRYRAHGTRGWSGPGGNRVTSLDLRTSAVTRTMG